MHRSLRSRVPLSLRRVGAWQVLQLRPSLLAFVAAVVAADAVAIVVALRVTAVRPADLLVFGLLLACGAVTVEMTRRTGETALFVKDVGAVWELPMAILLPPAFALLAPLPRFALMQWRIRKIAPHRRVFSAAAISLSYGSVYVAFHEFSRIAAMSLSGTASQATTWALVVAACAVLQWVVSHSLVFIAVKSSDPSASIRGMIFARESVQNDLIEASVAILMTVGIAVSPVTILFALPFVALLQRSSRHDQLLNESRVDAKTGLLNAATWRRESSAEVARAVRTGSPLSLALLDIDHFKAVNDRHGHLAGDEVLGTIGRTLQLLVREYDLVGRFGGEEFSLLMPQTDESGARNIAERIRAQVADLHIDTSSGPESEPIRLTISIGVAALTGAEDITELLAAADMALYRAKDAGRNKVWVTTDTASSGAAHREVSRVKSAPALP